MDLGDYTMVKEQGKMNEEEGTRKKEQGTKIVLGLDTGNNDL